MNPYRDNRQLEDITLVTRQVLSDLLDASEPTPEVSKRIQQLRRAARCSEPKLKAKRAKTIHNIALSRRRGTTLQVAPR
jgi:hypothetical protein